MCWMCNHPQATRADYLNYLRDTIAQYGWAVQGIERDHLHPPWAYTVGLTEYGLPELVTTGLSIARACELLNDVGAHVVHAGPPLAGEQIELIGGPTIEIVTVAEPTAHLLNALEIYGAGIRALQIVHADDRGHWPWEVGYRSARGGQPVLGERARPAETAA
jgi:hypothetical protein